MLTLKALNFLPSRCREDRREASPPKLRLWPSLELYAAMVSWLCLESPSFPSRRGQAPPSPTTKGERRWLSGSRFHGMPVRWEEFCEILLSAVTCIWFWCQCFFCFYVCIYRCFLNIFSTFTSTKKDKESLCCRLNCPFYITFWHTSVKPTCFFMWASASSTCSSQSTWSFSQPYLNTVLCAWRRSAFLVQLPSVQTCIWTWSTPPVELSHGPSSNQCWWGTSCTHPIHPQPGTSWRRYTMQHTCMSSTSIHRLNNSLILTWHTVVSTFPGCSYNFSCALPHGEQGTQSCTEHPVFVFTTIFHCGSISSMFDFVFSVLWTFQTATQINQVMNSCWYAAVSHAFVLVLSLSRPMPPCTSLQIWGKILRSGSNPPSTL